jgi:hypothetical protein
MRRARRIGLLCFGLAYENGASRSSVDRVKVAVAVWALHWMALGKYPKLSR